jgi:chromosome segregation ATPase
MSEFRTNPDARAWEIGTLRVALPLLWSAQDRDAYSGEQEHGHLDLTTALLRNLRDDTARLDARVTAHDARFDRVDTRFDRVDARLDKVETRLDRVETRLDGLDTRVAELTGEMRGGFDRLDGRIDRLHTYMVETTTRLDGRLEDLQATMHQMMNFMGQHGALASRVDACERDIVDLKERVL